MSIARGRRSDTAGDAPMIRSLAFAAPALAAILAAAPLFAQDDAGDKDAASKRRLAVMQKAIDNCRPSSPEIKSETALKFAAAPMLRYSDQTRSLLDAGV